MDKPADNFILRRATLRDLGAVIDLASESIVYSISPLRVILPEAAKQFRRNDLDNLRQLLDSPNLGFFVAETSNSEFVGHVIVVTHLKNSLTGEVEAMIVDISVKEEYWGSGVAVTLCNKAEEFARDQGMPYLELGVTSNNTRAIRFYEKAGFLEERKRMLKRL